jgi:hypothetical protein
VYSLVKRYRDIEKKGAVRYNIAEGHFRRTLCLYSPSSLTRYYGRRWYSTFNSRLGGR